MPIIGTAGARADARQCRIVLWAAAEKGRCRELWQRARKGQCASSAAGFCWRPDTYRDADGVHSTLTEARRMLKTPQRLFGIGLHDLPSMTPSQRQGRRRRKAHTARGAVRSSIPHSTGPSHFFQEGPSAAAQALVAALCRTAPRHDRARDTILAPCALRGHAAGTPPVDPFRVAAAAVSHCTHIPLACSPPGPHSLRSRPC
jgi:hypothetical protein